MKKVTACQPCKAPGLRRGTGLSGNRHPGTLRLLKDRRAFWSINPAQMGPTG